MMPVVTTLPPTEVFPMMAKASNTKMVPKIIPAPFSAAPETFGPTKLIEKLVPETEAITARATLNTPLPFSVCETVTNWPATGGEPETTLNA